MAYGAGQAAYFTGLAWVQEQCAEKLHFSPYAGTLNIRVDEESLFFLGELQKKEAIELLSPNPNFCNARALPACLNDLPVAVIMPDEKVTIHDRDIIEVISPVHLKETLLLRDGDRVMLAFEKFNQHSCPVRTQRSMRIQKPGVRSQNNHGIVFLLYSDSCILI